MRAAGGKVWGLQPVSAVVLPEATSFQESPASGHSQNSVVQKCGVIGRGQGEIGIQTAFVRPDGFPLCLDSDDGSVINNLRISSIRACTLSLNRTLTLPSWLTFTTWGSTMSCVCRKSSWVGTPQHPCCVGWKELTDEHVHLKRAAGTGGGFCQEWLLCWGWNGFEVDWWGQVLGPKKVRVTGESQEVCRTH